MYPFVEVVLLTAMEYQREEKKEKRRKRKRKSDVQIVDSSFRVDENEDPKTWRGQLTGFLSRWKAPSLKTIGRLLSAFTPRVDTGEIGVSKNLV